MPRTRSGRPAKSPKRFLLQKPNGQLTPRVQQVGPEHFGIVAIDCAKARSRYLLADFYGRPRHAPDPAVPPAHRGRLAAAPPAMAVAPAR
jgi:hypothetical protein